MEETYSLEADSFESKRTFRTLLLLIIFLLALVALTRDAKAQILEYRTGTLTGVAATVATNTTASCTNSIVTVRNNVGLSIWASFATTNACTSNITFNFVAGNGTVFNTTPLLTATFALNGTNTVIGFTNFAPSLIGNARTLKLLSITNPDTTNTVTINSVQYGHYY